MRRSEIGAPKTGSATGSGAFNRLQAGLRALVEQAISQLANAWSLRRWRGLLYRVRDVYRAAGYARTLDHPATLRACATA